MSWCAARRTWACSSTSSASTRRSSSSSTPSRSARSRPRTIDQERASWNAQREADQRALAEQRQQLEADRIQFEERRTRDAGVYYQDDGLGDANYAVVPASPAAAPERPWTALEWTMVIGVGGGVALSILYFWRTVGKN